MGIDEVADKLLGFDMCKFSSKVSYLNAKPKMNREKYLLPYKKIQVLTDSDTNIYQQNIIDDHYPNRPHVLEKLKLLEFCKRFEIVHKPCSVKHKDCHDDVA
jgi:hypothetical protein